MPGRMMTLEDIPGQEAGLVTKAEQLPSGLVVISAQAVANEGIGALEVKTGTVLEKEDGHGVRILFGTVEHTNVVCEPPSYLLSAVEPRSRAGATYAAFGFAEASAFPLSDGGRLLADARGYTPKDISPRWAALPSSESPAAGYTSRIERVANGVGEAWLVAEGIGLYMGLDPGDARLLAEVALDFSKLHADADPALGGSDQLVRPSHLFRISLAKPVGPN